MGLLCAALGTHDLPDGLVPFACEMGRVRFEAGQEYRFGLTFIGDAQESAEPLFSGLGRIGRSGGHDDEGPSPSFGRGFELVSLAEVPLPDFDAEVARLAGSHHVTLRFVSPFRLARPDESRSPGAGYLNAECFPAPYFLDRLLNRVFRLKNGRNLTRDERRQIVPDPAGAVAVAEHLFWLDVPVRGKPHGDNTRMKGITLGGVLGTVRLSGIPQDWWPWVVAASYAHAGESTHYGFGAFRICAPGFDDRPPFTPSFTLWSRLTNPDALVAAFQHVKTHSNVAGIDGQTTESFECELRAAVGALANDLAEAKYKCQPLLGFIGRQPRSHIRALAIPSVRDRVVQRAACHLLSPILDVLFEDCSFAYRKGFSRQGAARAIQRAYDEGYRWVLDADIASFFDSVEWERLFARLHALFPGEPLVGTIKSWVRAPVVFEGRTIERTQGLPQGAAISPLLANLFLNEFDEELLGDKYRLVRYADDFVVLCRDADEARRARDAARAALEKIGLSLNESKTEIRSIDSGFTYLGYLFCRSVALAGRDEPGESHVLAPDDVPPLSWLASVPFERIRALAPGAPAPIAQTVPLRTVPEAEDGRTPFYIVSAEVTAAARESTLIVSRPGQQTVRYPIRGISHVVVFGRSRVSMPLVQKLNHLAVPVYFCSSTGALLTAVTPHEPDWPAWMAQARAVGDPRTCLDLAREVVTAKLHNAAALAVRFRFANAAVAAADIRDLARQIVTAEGVATILGYEGRGAARYFEVLGQSLDPEWSFNGRRKRPATDPVNSMLSFGYRILYNHISTALIGAGLNPCLGLFHRTRGSHHALSSDLIEEFRFLVDSAVWAIIQRRRLKPADFVIEQHGTGQTLLGPLARRLFIDEIEKRLLTTFTPAAGHSMTYRQFIDRQAQHLRRFVMGTADHYQALRI